MAEGAESELRELAAAWDRALVLNDADAVGSFMADEWWSSAPTVASRTEAGSSPRFETDGPRTTS